MNTGNAMGPEGAGRSGGPIVRLTSADRMYLHDETSAWPCHFGGLAVVEGGPLLDESDRLRLDEIRQRLGRRIARVPDLRQRLYFPGPLRGGPIWVDDARFALERHVHETAVEAPGGDAQLLEAAARICADLLDRSRPLWELWFLTGLSDRRVGVLLKLHHAVADGAASVAVMGSLFDAEPDATDPPATAWQPAPIPRESALLVDNVLGKARAAGRAAALLAHPRRIARAARLFGVVIRRTLGQKGAPRTSLNGVVQAGRVVRFLRFDLATLKVVAHAHDGKLNDVVLDLWAGGLRRLLESRGELAEGLELVAGQAVSLRTPAESRSVDNQAGTMVLRLPVWEADPARRLDLIVATTRATKALQNAGAIMAIVAALSATPIGRYMNTRQRAVNVIVTNVVGPPVPMFALGARILDIVPIIQLVGNVGLTQCAFSYAGQVFLVVTADAHGFPDIDVLMEGMEHDWRALTGSRAAELVPA